MKVSLRQKGSFGHEPFTLCKISSPSHLLQWVLRDENAAISVILPMSWWKQHCASDTKMNWCGRRDLDPGYRLGRAFGSRP